MTKQQTPSQIRQNWLESVAVMIRAYFAEHGYTVPAKVRISVGFPKGTAGEGKVIAGQCWPPQSSSDGHTEIFLSPLTRDTNSVVNTLTHEFVHGTVGCQCGHKGAFKTCALKVGFLAPMTSTPSGDGMNAFTAKVVAKLGAYPAGALSVADRKKQGTRLLKAECPDCGFCVRITRKWAEVGMPICPVDGVSFGCETIDDEDSEGE